MSKFITAFLAFVLVFLLAAPAVPAHMQDDNPPAPVPAETGAFYTGEYRNMLAEWGLSDDEIQARIDEVWNQLFYGNDATDGNVLFKD
jgi:hypothetical protein